MTTFLPLSPSAATDGVVRPGFGQIEARQRRRARYERTAATWERAAALHRETARVLTARGDSVGAADATSNEERCRDQAERWWRLARLRMAS